PAGSRLFDALSQCGPHLVRFGGHQAAAGCELTSASLPAFRAAFCAAVEQLCSGSVVEANGHCLTVLPEDDLSKVMRDLELLEPCGQDNPRPVLVLDGRVVAAREVKGGHLSLRV